MATLTMSAGGGIVNPQECPEPVELGSYSVDSCCTCLYLMRNDKKRKKVTQGRCRANSASSLPVFTGGFRYKKWLRVQKTQGANCTTRHSWGERTDEGKVPTPWSQSGADERNPVLTPEFCSKGYLGSEWAGLTVSRDAHQPLVLNSLRKDRLPRKSCQEAAFLQSVFCVSQIELCTIATRISWGRRNAPRFIHIHTHTLFPQGQFTQYAFGMGGGYYCIQSRTWILIVMDCVAYTKKARLSSAASPVSLRMTFFDLVFLNR